MIKSSNNCLLLEAPDITKLNFSKKEEIKAYGLRELKLDVEMPKNNIGLIYSKNTINNITSKFIELVF